MQPSRWPSRLWVLPVALLLQAAWAQGAERPTNLVRDGDFERPDLAFGKGDAPGVWVPFIHAPEGVSIGLADGAGRSSSRAVRYTRTSAGSHNVHFDQVVPVAPNTLYEVRAWVRGDGVLKPLLSVAAPDWRPLAVVGAPTGVDWCELRLAFNSLDHEWVRLEWFPGATGQLYTGVAGSSTSTRRWQRSSAPWAYRSRRCGSTD